MTLALTMPAIVRSLVDRAEVEVVVVGSGDLPIGGCCFFA
jgi:hypothetical protein